MKSQSENECISLTVLFAARIIPRRRWCILRDFLLSDYALPTRPESGWQAKAQSPFNGTAQPMDIEEEGQSQTMGRQWLKKHVALCLHPAENGIEIKFVLALPCVWMAPFFCLMLVMKSTTEIYIYINRDGFKFQMEEPVCQITPTFVTPQVC